jgi:hypothetical protein
VAAKNACGLPKSNRSPRYWWLVMRPNDIEVCLKPPARDVDVVISADLATFTEVWLGYDSASQRCKCCEDPFLGNERMRFRE